MYSKPDSIRHHKNTDSFCQCTFYSPPLLVYWRLDVTVMHIIVVFDVRWRKLLGGEYCWVCSTDEWDGFFDVDLEKLVRNRA